MRPVSTRAVRLIWVGKIECTHETLVKIWGGWAFGRVNRSHRRNLQGRPGMLRRVREGWRWIGPTKVRVSMV
jgi:hypothetical protein